MKHYFFYKELIVVLCCLMYPGCQDSTKTVTSSYSYIEPAYSNIRLQPQEDTLHFQLNERTYNEIRSFNYFESNGAAYIGFYDRRSESVSIYEFSSQKLLKRVGLKRRFKEELYKASIYIKGFDSIYITNRRNLYIIDTAGVVKENIDFLKKSDKEAFFSSTLPIVFSRDYVYVAARPSIQETSLKEHKLWKVLYRYDMRSNTRERYYSLPMIYHQNLYGYHFLEYSYCFNDRGNFVFSFPADTNIYETNLTDYHRSYYGRSRFQANNITPVSKEALMNDESTKQYLLRCAYGPIYYDPYRKRYLRAAYQKISEADYKVKKLKRKRSVIIFDQDFRIIGESEIETGFSLSAVFFAPNGNIYARARAADPYALHFVRLTYAEKDEHLQLSKY